MNVGWMKGRCCSVMVIFGVMFGVIVWMLVCLDCGIWSGWWSVIVWFFCWIWWWFVSWWVRMLVLWWIFVRCCVCMKRLFVCGVNWVMFGGLFCCCFSCFWFV